MRLIVRKQVLFVCLSVFYCATAWAQPSNDQCSNAISILLDGNPVSANNTGTLVNGPNPNCGGTNIKDVWFSFVYNGGSVNISTILGTNNDTRLAIYSSCGGQQLACDDDSGPGLASSITLNCSALTAGNTYYIQAGGYNAITGTFSVVGTENLQGCTNPIAGNYNACATVDDGTCAVVPANDECANALALTVDAPAQGANNSLATNSGANPSCGNSGSNLMKDIWFSFVATADALQIDVAAGTLGDTRAALYDACGGNEIACNDDIGAGNNASRITLNCGDLTEGNTYYIRAGGYSNQSGTFSVQVSTVSSCVPGESCNMAFVALEGLNSVPQPNTWYEFTPDSSGQWKISTCDLAACDTKIWIYDYCNMANFDDTNEATLTYSDDVCGVQAEATPLLVGGQTYYLRVGDTGGDCGTGAFDFLIEYLGPLSGCMDVNACNYTPIAEVPGPCYYNDDPNCTDLGPDLEVQENLVYTSLYSTTFNSTDPCYINEGCLQGYGTRQIFRFSTQIKNIGTQDYYIGVPSANNPQFEYDECHNHYHYQGYAEYLLYDQDGNPMPQIGFKNGFCVLDIACPSGIPAKFTCGKMGITAGCWDTYSSGLSCQWIDVTDVPAGDYFLVVRTNWDQSPDSLGHYELRYDNNWAQVCIHFDRDANNNIINFTKDISNCPVIEDCIGIPFGNNYPDCANNCPGIVKRGDLTGEGAFTEEDVHDYLEGTITGAVPVSPCTDLNQDGEISVADAAYLHACIRGQELLGIAPEDMEDCPYDPEIVNPSETTTLAVFDINENAGYVDISVLNPDNFIGGIEFTVSGIELSDVQSLVDPIYLTTHIHFAVGGNHVTILTEDETYYDKYSLEEPIIRLYYSNISGSEVCISSIIDVIDESNHNTLTIIGDCQSFASECSGDFNGDGVINISDLLLFNAAFGCVADCGNTDLNGDGVVNTSDVLLFLAVFGTTCP